MPPVPRRWERPFHAPASNKDFIAENAFAAMTAAPREFEFDLRNPSGWLAWPPGTSTPGRRADHVSLHVLAQSPQHAGFKTKTQTDWLKTDTYGRVPAYLDRVKREIESEREYILSLLDQQAMEAEAESGAQTRELSSDERNELIGWYRTGCCIGDVCWCLMNSAVFARWPSPRTIRDGWSSPGAPCYALVAFSAASSHQHHHHHLVHLIHAYTRWFSSLVPYVPCRCAQGEVGRRERQVPADQPPQDLHIQQLYGRDQVVSAADNRWVN